MAHPYLALRPTRNGRVSHYAVAGSKNPLPLGMGSVKNGEDAIKRVIAIDRDGKAIPPCGACREFMTQLMPEEYRKIEIMMDYEKMRVVTLGELTPEWWL